MNMYTYIPRKESRHEIRASVPRRVQPALRLLLLLLLLLLQLLLLLLLLQQLLLLSLNLILITVRRPCQYALPPTLTPAPAPAPCSLAGREGTAAERGRGGDAGLHHQHHQGGSVLDITVRATFHGV